MESSLAFRQEGVLRTWKSLLNTMSQLHGTSWDWCLLTYVIRPARVKVGAEPKGLEVGGLVVP